jgi:hypothetical protein
MIAKLRLLTFLFLSIAANAATQAHIVQVVNQAATATRLVSPGGSPLAATGVSLVVTVSGTSAAPFPDGTATIFDGGISLGSVPLVAGSASITQNFSTFGAHQLSACYTGNNNYQTSCSDPLQLTILPPYTLEPTNNSGTVSASTTFSDQLKVVPAAGFVGVVNLACQVPSGQCGISNTSLTFSGNSLPQSVKASFVPSIPSSTIAFLLPFVGALVSKLNRRRIRKSIAVFSIGSAMIFCLTGCGPLVAFPYVPPITMLVDATSTTYSQAVSYQIQVNTGGTTP